jgi:predicted peroxiredoxin
MAMNGTRRLVIVVWSCGPDRPDGAMLAATPFVYALVARALDREVEMHFTSSAVRWLVAGVAGAARTGRASDKSVGDYLDEARAAGVRIYACAMARHEHAERDALIDAIDGIAGAASVIGALADGDAQLMVF